MRNMLSAHLSLLQKLLLVQSQPSKPLNAQYSAKALRTSVLYMQPRKAKAEAYGSNTARDLG